MWTSPDGQYRNQIGYILCSQRWRSSAAAAAAAAGKLLQSCLTLCSPIDSSPPGSPIPGIFQTRTLEWVAILFSNAWKWKVKVKSLSHVRLFTTPWTAAYQIPPPMGFSRQEYWSAIAFSLEKLCCCCCCLSVCKNKTGADCGSDHELLIVKWRLKSKTVGRTTRSSSQSVISVALSCLTLCDPMDCSTLGFPVHHQLPELA